MRVLSCRIVVVLLALALVRPSGPAAAQVERGSRYVSLDHWAYHYLDRLRERGYLSELAPLVRPYRRAAVVKALERLEPRRLAPAPARWVELLRREFRREPVRERGAASYRWGLDLAAGARAADTDRLDPVRPVGSGGVWPYGQLGVWLETGPVVAVSRVRSDAYFPDDPDGEDVGRRLEARSEEAYLAAQFPAASIFLGRMARNWGPGGSPGLMVSDVPATYPHLGIDVRAGPVRIHSLTAELDTLGPARRYLSGHRVDFAPTSDVVVSFGEAILYAGPGVSLSPRFLNPLDFLFFDHDNTPRDLTMNLMLDIQLWFRKPGFVFYAEGLIDDVDVNPPPSREDREPSLYALRAGLKLPGLTRHVDLSAEYTVASSFVYRSRQVIDDYRYLRRGIGANFADFDRLDLTADLHLGATGLTVSPVVSLLRQGEGDIRQPNAPSDLPPDEYLGSPSLFLGQKETTVRLALAGRFQPTHYLWLAWEIGENFVQDAGHVAGADDTELTVLGELGLRLRW